MTKLEYLHHSILSTLQNGYFKKSAAKHYSSS